MLGAVVPLKFFHHLTPKYGLLCILNQVRTDRWTRIPHSSRASVGEAFFNLEVTSGTWEALVSKEG